MHRKVLEKISEERTAECSHDPLSRAECGGIDSAVPLFRNFLCRADRISVRRLPVSNHLGREVLDDWGAVPVGRSSVEESNWYAGNGWHADSVVRFDCNFPVDNHVD